MQWILLPFLPGNWKNRKNNLCVSSYPFLPPGLYFCSYPFFLLNHVPSNISFTELFLPDTNLSQSKNESSHNAAFPSSYCFPWKKNSLKELSVLTLFTSPSILPWTGVCWAFAPVTPLITSNSILAKSNNQFSHLFLLNLAAWAHLVTPSILKHFLNF